MDGIRNWIHWLAGFAAIFVAVVGGLYVAARHEPAFYLAVVVGEPTEQQRASDEFLTTMASLVSHAQRVGPWTATLSAAQINGWLAVDLPLNHAPLLPENVSEPRIEFRAQRARIAYRWHWGPTSTVVSAEVDIRLVEPNRWAVRFEQFRAGAIPLPMSTVVDGITRWAADQAIPVRWGKSHGAPIAFVSLPDFTSGERPTLQCRAWEMKDGILRFAGVVTAPVARSEASNDHHAVGSKLSNQR